MKPAPGLIAAASICLAVLAGCSKPAGTEAAAAASKPAPPTAVAVARAELRAVDRTLSVTGSLHPDETASVSAEVPGRVAAILVDFGQPVRKGQVVVELDKRELSLQLARAKASLAQALARIGLEPGQEDTRPESTPAIRQATALMEDARSKYENASRLVKTGDIAQERHNELEKAYRSRQAAVDLARDEMRTQLASIQALKAEVDLAQKRFNDASVRAPWDGAVSDKLISPGQYVKENVPLLNIIKTNPMRLRLEVPENAAAAVAVGATIEFTTDALRGEWFKAVVRELNPTLDSKSRSLTAEARLQTSNPRLRPGMFVQVQLVTERDVKVTVVPKNSIYTLAGLTKLFVVRDGRAFEKRFSPGMEIDGWIEVPGGLVQPGDTVAVSAQAQLVDGAAVQPNGQRTSNGAAAGGDKS